MYERGLRCGQDVWEVVVEGSRRRSFIKQTSSTGDRKVESSTEVTGAWSVALIQRLIQAVR